MPSLICLCGRIGSGKTIAASYIKQLGPVVVLDVDNLMHPLFGDSMDRHLFDRNLQIIIHWLSDIANQTLKAGVSVVMDFGFWTRKNRQQILSCILDFPVHFLYLEIDENTQAERVLGRNQQPNKTYTFDLESLTILNQMFQEPETNEGILVQKTHTDQLLVGECDWWLKEKLFVRGQ